MKMVETTALQEDKVLVIFLPDCHESLAGIIAGRIRERYHKPVFILTKAEQGAKGSGRSIENYDMYEEMSKCKACLPSLEDIRWQQDYRFRNVRGDE